MIELPKVKEEVEEMDSLQSWGRFFNAKTKEEFEMLVEKSPDLGVAYEQLQKISADDVKRAEYIRREKEIRDQITYLEEATKQGIERGIEQVALEMLKNEFPFEEIMRLTGLSMEKIKELETKNK